VSQHTCHALALALDVALEILVPLVFHCRVECRIEQVDAVAFELREPNHILSQRSEGGVEVDHPALSARRSRDCSTFKIPWNRVRSLASVNA
jgi:hypothetical protein